ncbi:hypothetical protein D049_3440B, partial [Vibrio parahaemolyticus VPTS-2010]
CSAMD